MVVTDTNRFRTGLAGIATCPVSKLALTLLGLHVLRTDVTSWDIPLQADRPCITLVLVDGCTSQAIGFVLQAFPVGEHEHIAKGIADTDLDAVVLSTGGGGRSAGDHVQTIEVVMLFVSCPDLQGNRRADPLAAQAPDTRVRRIGQRVR